MHLSQTQHGGMRTSFPGSVLRAVLARVAAATSLVLLLTSAATADPISWMYTGEVIYLYDEGAIPVGTSANFRVTVHDRTRDFLEETGAEVPDWAGAYWSSLTVWLPGGHYILDSAVLEINYDPVFLVPWPGSVLLRQFRWEGLPLFGFPMGFTDCYGDADGGCMDRAGGGADPASDGVPGVIPTFEFSIRPSIGPGDGAPGPLLTIRGVDPEQIAEPVTVLMIGAGVTALAGHRRWRRRLR